MNRYRMITIAIALLICGCAAWTADWVRPTITSTRVGGVYNPDSELAAIMEPLIRSDGREIARQLTRLMLAHDATDLYIVVNAEERDMPSVKLAFSRGRTERVRDDDSVSLYFRTKDAVYEISVASDGKMDSARWVGNKEDASWQSNAKWEVSHPDDWTGMLTLPLASIGSPTDGGVIDFAAVRREAPLSETSGWPSYSGGKNPPTDWGALHFGKAGGVFTSQFIPTRPNPGPGKLIYWVRPPEITGAGEALYSTGEPPTPMPFTKAAVNTGGGWYTYDFTIPPGAPGRIQGVMRANGEVIHATAIMPVPMPFLTREVEASLTRCYALRKSAAGVGSASDRQAFLQALTPLTHELITALSDARRALAEPASEARAATLTKLTESAEKLDWRTHMLAGRLGALKGGSAARGFSVGTMHSVVKLKWFDTALVYGKPVRLRAARRERESAQIVIVPFDKPLENVKVTWTDLVGPKGTAISKDDVRVDEVGYVKTTPPDYETEYVGWWPDPLMPLDNFSIPVHHTQPLWLTVYANEKTPAGLYKGQVGIDAGPAGKLSVPVEVDVLDYDLPLAGKLRTIFGYDWNKETVGWYKWDTPQFRPFDEYKKIPQDFARNMWDMTLSYRINAGGLYEFLPFPRWEDVDFCLARGMNNYQLGIAEGVDKYLRHFKDLADKARAKGILPMSYVYGWDEGAEAYPSVRQQMLDQWTQLKKEIPDLARADVYTKPGDEIMQALDIVMPLTPGLEDRARWDRWRKAGKVVGAYICCSPRHPYANFFIDYPAIDQRIVFWQLYKYGATFFLDYSINGWWNLNDKAGPRWPDVPWITASHGNDNGDGHMVYPGKNGVLPSVRLANVRDGIEDYEAFGVLADLTSQLDPAKQAKLIAENKKLLTVPDDVTRNMATYTQDPRVLLAARVRLDNAILKTKRALGGQNSH